MGWQCGPAILSLPSEKGNCVDGKRTWWHGSTVQIDDFGAQIGGKGVHFGSREQAAMRNRAFLHEVEIDLKVVGRARDRQDWRSVARRSRAAGKDGVLYLNRFEGLRTERLEELLARGLGNRLDAMTDREFRRLVPEAEDSVLVVNPEAVRLVRVFDREGRIVFHFDEKMANPLHEPAPPEPGR